MSAIAGLAFDAGTLLDRDRSGQVRMGLHHQGSASPTRLRVVKGPCRGLVLRQRIRIRLSLVSDRGGQPTPAAAAAWFARHGGLTGIPAQGWRQLSRSGSGATVESGAVTLHVIQGPDRTWQVDSGNRCP